MMDKYEYIPAEQLKDRIIERADITDKFTVDFFMDNNIDVLYVIECGRLYGVVTPGDFLRYCEMHYKNSSYINIEFRYISENDFDLAGNIFENFPLIHEVPVVIDNELKGIISNRRARPEKSWEKIRNQLSWYTSECMEYAYTVVRRFLKKNKNVKVYLYASTINWKQLYDNNQKKIIERTMGKMSSRFNGPTGISRFSQMSDTEHELFFKELYSKKYVEQRIEDMRKLKVIPQNGVRMLSDLSSANYNIRDGYRMTERGNGKNGKRRIYFLGGCVWFGLYVDDKHTIEHYLQNMIGYDDCEIVNCGNSGKWILDRLVTEEFSQHDVAVIFMHYPGESIAWLRCREEFSNVILKTNLAEVFDIENIDEYIFDNPYHCNHIINERIAKVMYNDICDELSKGSDLKECKREALQDYYIPWGTAFFYKYYFRHNNIVKLDSSLKKGAVVMNCNPFTKGHRYLIEQAAKQVDYLYIFVVEEDKSEFSFEDRFNIVKLGTEDLKNVMIIPSGKYIVSHKASSQYVEKDDAEEINSVDYDIHVFAEVIAKELDITCRFAGSEPIDRITNGYNETMARILPAEGIEFIEIPRKKTDDDDVISASTVRRLLLEKKYEQLEKYLPETTINYIREHINHDI